MFLTRYVHLPKSIVIFFTLLLTGFRVFPHTPHATGCPDAFLNDSGFYYYWSGSWVPSQSSVAFYHEDGRSKEIINRYWSSSQQTWRNSSRKAYQYGQYSTPDVILLFAYNATLQRWDTASRQWFSHTLNSETDTAVTQQYNGDGTWSDLRRTVFDYDSIGNQILYQYETYDTSLGTWMVHYRFVYEYDGFLQTGFVRQKWDTASLSWIYEYRKSFKYDTFSNLTEDLFEDYDPPTDTWRPQTRITYTYNSEGHLERELYESWYDTLWKNSAEYLYFEDAQTYDTLVLFRIWTGSNWQDNYRYRYLNDACGNLLEETGQYLDQGAWVNDYKIVRFFTPLYNPLVVEVIDSIDVSCYGAADGSALAAASGGTPPYDYLWDDPAQTNDSVVTGLVGNRWYTVTVIDASGDTATDRVFIAEPEPVITGPIEGDTLVNPGEIHEYEVEEHEGSVYHWTVHGGKFVEETTGPEIAVFWIKPGVWSLTVTETDSAGCTGEPVTLTIYSGTVGIASQNQERILVFPNPVQSILNIQVRPLKSYQVTLTGLDGRILRSERALYRDVRLNLTALPDGLYLLRVQESDGTEHIVKVLKAASR